MNTERAVQQFWGASLAWRGRSETQHTTETLFKKLELLYDPVNHRSHKLASQASELSNMIVKWKKQRQPKPRRKLTNLVTLPVKQKQVTKAA